MFTVKHLSGIETFSRYSDAMNFIARAQKPDLFIRSFKVYLRGKLLSRMVFRTGKLIYAVLY